MYKRQLLYQPALPGLLSDGALSKETPSVPEPHPKAAVIREASPYPVEQPTISAFLGPVIVSRPRTYSICALTFVAQPTGWAVVHIKPRMRGLIITIVFRLPSSKLRVSRRRAQHHTFCNGIPHGSTNVVNPWAISTNGHGYRSFIGEPMLPITIQSEDPLTLKRHLLP